MEISSSRMVVSHRVASAVSVMLTREEMLESADSLEASLSVDESSVREVSTLREKQDGRGRVREQKVLKHQVRGTLQQVNGTTTAGPDEERSAVLAQSCRRNCVAGTYLAIPPTKLETSEAVEASEGDEASVAVRLCVKASSSPRSTYKGRQVKSRRVSLECLRCEGGHGRP